MYSWFYYYFMTSIISQIFPKKQMKLIDITLLISSRTKIQIQVCLVSKSVFLLCILPANINCKCGCHLVIHVCLSVSGAVLSILQLQCADIYRGLPW